MSKTFKEFAEACWDSHKQVGTKMKGGKRVPNCVPKNEEEEIEEVSAAMRALRRRRQRVLMQRKQWQSMVQHLRWVYLHQR